MSIFELKLCDVCNCVLFFAGTGAISEDGVGKQQTSKDGRCGEAGTS